MTISEMMEKTWSQYEAEWESGNRELAEIIGDAYTAMDIIELGQDVEERREMMERTYYELGRMVTKDMISGKETPEIEVYRMLEEALVNAGILEADEEPQEEEPEELDCTNDAQHFDEWAADQRFDMYRDLALMGYEY